MLRDFLEYRVNLPAYAGYRNKAIKRVCTTNCVQLERFYEMYLDLEKLEHSDSLFIKFMEEYNQKICPNDIKISYIDGKVKCEKHITEDNSYNNDVEVPYL